MNREDDASVGHFKSSIDEIASQVRNKHHTQVTAGLGYVCHTEGDYQRGYAEASEALDVGRCLHRNAGCARFNLLGAYRYIANLRT